MNQWAICDSQDWVLGFVEADAEPPADGRVFRLMTVPVAGWPEAPANLARLKWAAGAVLYVDLRTEQQAWTDARSRRDAMLEATDWVVTRAVERGEAVPTAWVTYRQALRDITLQASPFNVNWPTRPE